MPSVQPGSEPRTHAKRSRQEISISKKRLDQAAAASK
jgi:hypothetical protein